MPERAELSPEPSLSQAVAIAKLNGLLLRVSEPYRSELGHESATRLIAAGDEGPLRGTIDPSAFTEIQKNLKYYPCWPPLIYALRTAADFAIGSSVWLRQEDANSAFKRFSVVDHRGGLTPRVVLQRQAIGAAAFLRSYVRPCYPGLMSDF